MGTETKVFVSLFVLAVIIGITFLVFNLCTTKVFNGYYLSSREGYHNIYINWENRIDERAFRTTNSQEALDVYDRLKRGCKNENKN